ncbi:MAG: hypothetical protein CM1200mP30_31680 [Pseudomonadota bacterium]|nr:MAG: hypothetical protein CM1200mP30_31680 [Pseudomonadota bacterium]
MFKFLGKVSTKSYFELFPVFDPFVFRMKVNLNARLLKFDVHILQPALPKKNPKLFPIPFASPSESEIITSLAT